MAAAKRIAKQGARGTAAGVAELRALVETHAPGACPRCGEALSSRSALARRALRIAAQLAAGRAGLRRRGRGRRAAEGAAMDLLALAEALLHSDGACRRPPAAFTRGT
ncbi:hypothetical protein [Anaeromyxobacter dehalogenans]|uniref:Uncharacterized protein n=1 Tax=Anaeromyxobacter dehalogenans (strain 2CP-C) TaxID=290397 RepID=Q2IIU2_ANADE|nr:hypothetical protein [Anaeromyxobacter dehalogenans]ABC81573.1 hypothetical protein Adeh_1800 [Anaeromyxobacter dehalogenans 2CP-C]